MNVSPRELEAGDIDDMILDGLAARNLPAAMFEIEITEESPVDPDRVDEKLGRLSHAGISIALDDFGTGFSTLASLKDKRISKVKIDQGFIRSLAKSREDRLLVKTVIDWQNDWDRGHGRGRRNASGSASSANTWLQNRSWFPVLQGGAVEPSA